MPIPHPLVTIDLISHVSCGDFDAWRGCPKCEAIRAILVEIAKEQSHLPPNLSVKD